MDINKILEDLRRERTQLEEAILSLERLAAGGKRRGRPPAWLKEATAAVNAAGEDEDVTPAEPKRRGRPAGSKSKQSASAEG